MPNTSNKRVLINGDLYKELNSDTVSLKIGCMTTISKTKVSPECTKNLIYLNTNLAKKLLVPSRSYFPYYIKENTIKLGPSVGIIISSKNPNNQVPKGKQGRVYKEMIVYGKDKGLFIFIFYAEGVNWQRRSINGYTINNSGKWIKGNFALPTIVYNRINYRSIESRKNIRALFKKLENEPHIYVFNTRFLNKWEVHETLHSIPACQKFLANTMKYSRKNLRILLEKHKEVFLKPINNSRGHGIIKIISTHHNSFLYSKADKNIPKWHSCSSFYTLFEALNRMGIKENRYLIQEGIDLAKVNNQVFDLRTQVQKDGNGRWVITGVGARIAGKNRFVTHIPNGGTAASYENVINTSYGKSSSKKTKIDQGLQTICSIIPPTLEEGLKIKLAILSLDIGVDSEGDMWLLEVNSKPASFDENDIRLKHLHYLTDYFVYAAQKISKE